MTDHRAMGKSELASFSSDKYKTVNKPKDKWRRKRGSSTLCGSGPLQASNSNAKAVQTKNVALLSTE